jgi:hypothetical protein
MAFQAPPSDVIQHAVNTLATATILSTLVGWLPPIAALLGIIWFLIQIFESKTGQRFVRWIKFWKRK